MLIDTRNPEAADWIADYATREHYRYTTTDGSRFYAHVRVGLDQQRNETLPLGATADDAGARSFEMRAAILRKLADEDDFRARCLRGTLAEWERERLARAERWVAAYDRQTEILEDDPHGEDETLDADCDECEAIMRACDSSR